MTIIEYAPNKFYTLYRDYGSICHGGLFVNIDTWEGIEVIDLDSAAGVDWINMIVYGSFFVDTKTIQNGGECCGINQKTINRIIKTWIIYDEKYSHSYSYLMSQYSEDSEFIHRLLMAFELCHSYMGFDGYTRNVIIAPEKTEDNFDWDSYTEDQIKEIAESWQAEYILTLDVEKTLTIELKKDIELCE
jgi:hypothetical protein